MGNKKDGQVPLDKTKPNLSSDPLTPKQRAFVKEYLKHFNGAKAARDAGFEDRHEASKLLAKPNIQAELQRRIKKQEVENDLTKSWVLKHLKNIVTYDPAQHFEISTNGTVRLKPTDIREPFPKRLAQHMDISSGEASSSSSEGSSDSHSFSYRGKDRIRALELIAKLMGYMDARTGAFDPASREAHQQRISDAIRRRTG